MTRRLIRALVPVLASLGLAAACARQGRPPGGPPDHRPPFVVAVTPDTFATVPPGKGEIKVTFNERISERTSGGPLDDAVSVSPRTGDVRVEHGRDGLNITLDGGFRPGLVYRVRVEPVIQDMFGNTMRVPYEWVFTTGGEFNQNAVGGLVWDRVTGDVLEDVTVLLRPGQPGTPAFDSTPANAAITDTAGIFTLRYVPADTFTVIAFQDRNRNDQADAFEAQGRRTGLVVGATDTVVTSLPIMVPDTTPPRVVRIETVDSMTLRVTMDDPLDPLEPLGRVVPGLYREEGNSPAVERILHEREWTALADSLAEARQAAAPTPPADTAAQAGDSAAAAAAAPPSGRPPARLPAAGRPRSAAAAGQPTREFLPDGSPVPTRTFVVRLDGPLEPGEAYTVRVQGVTNLAGLTSESEEAVVTRPVPEAPPAAAASDTAGVPPDTAAGPPDSLRAPPDTNRVRIRRPGHE